LTGRPLQYLLNCKVFVLIYNYMGLLLCYTTGALCFSGWSNKRHWHRLSTHSTGTPQYEGE